MTYYDVTEGTGQTVYATLGTTNNPDQVNLVGCTQIAQAWREGMFWRACKAYRRTFVTFKTALEGRLVQPGDNIYVCHDALGWGQWAELYNIGSASLCLTNPVSFGSDSSDTLYMRNIDGTPLQMTVTPNLNPYFVNISGSIPGGLTSGTVTGDERATRTAVALSTTASPVQDCKVLKVTVNGNEYEISCVVDDPRCYTADTGSVPPASVCFSLQYDPMSSAAMAFEAATLAGNATVISPGIPLTGLTVTKYTFGTLANYLLTWNPGQYSSFQITMQFVYGNWLTAPGSPTAKSQLYVLIPGAWPVANFLVTPVVNGSPLNSAAISLLSTSFKSFTF